MSEINAEFNFPPQSLNDWKETATQELDGADPFQKLTCDVNGIVVKPYYDVAEIPATETPYALHSQYTESTSPRNWSNSPKIIVTDSNEANAKALALLNSGADGILFELTGDANPNTLLANIELPYCNISFIANANSTSFIESFHAFAQNKFDTSTIVGNFFYHENTHNDATTARFKQWKNFRSAGIIISPHNDPAQELAQTLAQVCQYIDRSATKPDDVINSTSFLLQAGTDFFLEIAKLKTLRYLWHQVASAYGVTQPSPLFIHSLLPPFTKKEFQPNGNMIQQTSSSLASILGGCNAITLQPEEDNNTMMSRIALNVSTILREESHLAKVADPVAGAYYIEALTDQLAQKTWQQFQALVK